MSGRDARKRELWATGIGGFAILMWAGLALLTVRARGIPPFELLGLSFGVAFLGGMLVLAARGGDALMQLRQPLAAWLTAFAGIFVYHALYFFALSAAPSAQASLIAYLWPLLIVLLSAAVPGGDRLRARHVVGALLGLGGTVLLLTEHASGQPELGSISGYVAALGCAVVWSGYSVTNRRFATTPSSILVGVSGAVAMAGGVAHLAFETGVRPNADQWPAIVILGLGPTGLAFLAWDHATKHGRLPLLGALSYLAPLISTVLLVFAGQATATPSLLVAAVSIMGGALVATGLPMRQAEPRRGR